MCDAGRPGSVLSSVCIFMVAGSSSSTVPGSTSEYDSTRMGPDGELVSTFTLSGRAASTTACNAFMRASSHTKLRFRPETTRPWNSPGAAAARGIQMSPALLASN